ncbi:MAG: cupin domain-containing protein [Mesorhizobium sp.]|nr:MAG: cupin domain-containing protein [Mesorhizobium sp.]
MSSKSRHVISMAIQKPSFEGPAGSIKHVDVENLSILRRLSLRHLVLAPGGVREPHWHANANELGYCIRGTALITIAANHSERASFLVNAGDMFFVPSGAMHCIANWGSDTAEFILGFSHEKPEDFGMHASFAAMSDSVLGNTYDLPAEALSHFDRSTPGRKMFTLGKGPDVEEQAHHINSFKYSVEATPPQIDFRAGTAHTSKAALWPILRDIAMFSVRISGVGMREPHWHPDTAEMGYVVAGKARMTILDPDGTTDTYILGPGDSYFIPRAYPHHIENLGDEACHFLIFFDQTSPGDIGYRTLINVFSREVIAATLGLADSELPAFPLTEIDPLLVARINTVDAVN